VAVPRGRLPALGLVGVLDTTANLLYASASTAGVVSVAAVLASLYPVVTVMLARVVLHERLTRIQASGVASALVGVALIAMP
jgi:drug/metabolite transporter (DMT)-like permease